MSVINTVDSKVYGDRGASERFEKKSGSSLVAGEFAGRFVNGTSQGLVDRYDDSDIDMDFLGLVEDDEVVDYSNAVKVGVNGGTLGFSGNISVAGSTAAKSGDPVFALSHLTSSLTIAKANMSQERVGILLVQVGGASSLLWSVLFLPPIARSPEAKPAIGPVATLLTADGAVPQASYGHNGAYIPVTGGSSAVLTLAVPVTQEIGNVIRFHRIDGTGTHTIAFASEAGAVVLAIADEEVVVLQAVSTSYYRRIG